MTVRLIAVDKTACFLPLKFRVIVYILTIISVGMLLLSSCSTKKNTALSREWQAFNTRYNVYFNGDEHYRETLAEMEKNYEDDYTRQLLMHPAEARADQKYPQPSGNFNRTIEKMQKAIELHSITRKPQHRSSSQKEREFRAREEFNPFLHNAWMMLGRAQYFNGDFMGAATTFLYISKHFSWLPETVTEARLWEARSYLALGWTYEAENALHLVKEKDLINKNLRELYNYVEADYFIRNNRINEAFPYLKEAAKEASGSQKTRLWFLLGQLYQLSGDRTNAFEAFKKAEGGPSTSYRTKFNARIKQSEVYAGDDYNKEIKSLKSMAKYQRNKEYLDQIYYAIGNIYLANRDTLQAKENYIMAMDKSEKQDIAKALAQLALGHIYFSEKNYIGAQPYYAQALPFLSENYPEYFLLVKRSDVLDRLALYSQNVVLQDSLLALSKLSPQDRLKAAEKLVTQLKQKEKRAEEIASEISEESIAPGFQINNDDSWYFYNDYIKNAGKAEFLRKWGPRKLEDDWRRSNKNTFSFDEFNYSDEVEIDETNIKSYPDNVNGAEKNLKLKESDPHFVEYYLKQIPQTPEQIELANDVIQESLYNMGVILKDDLNDYAAARKKFIELEQRYPDNIYRLDAYYNLYIMAALSGDFAEAESWRQKILKDFPESNYGIAMKDPNYFQNLKKMHEVQENIYEKAYQAYLSNNNEIVHHLTDEMETNYPLSPILPKFIFIDGLSYFTEGDNEKFKERLIELLQRWPDTDMTDMASAILRGIKSGKTLRNSGNNTRGMIWTTRLSDIEKEMTDENLTSEFEKDPDSPQYLVLAFPKNTTNPNMVLYEIAKFNFSTFLIKDFDLEQMSFSDVGLLIVKGFANLKELEHYRNIMERYNLDLGPDVTPIMISKQDFETLLKEGKTFEEYFEAAPYSPVILEEIE